MKLTKQQKAGKQLDRYRESLDRMAWKLYGDYEDAAGSYHYSINGFPVSAKHTRDYGRRHGHDKGRSAGRLRRG